MAVSETREDSRSAADAATMLIDTDIHERLTNKEQLLPYMSPMWQRYITQYAGLFPGTQTPNCWPYAGPSPGNARLTWLNEDRSSATDLDTMRRHLFDEEGVTIGILNGSFYPSSMLGNYEFAQALASAYNDWQIETWLDPEPRLRGSIHVCAQEPAAAVREIERVAAHPQMVQVHLPTSTERQYGDPFYRPIFEAALKHDLVMSFHHDRNTRTVLGYPRYYVEWHSMAAPQAAMNQILSLICNGTFDIYPELKVVFLETGVAWVPWFMTRVDQQYREVRVEVPWVKKLPSEHFRNNVRLATQPLNDISPREFTDMVNGIGGESIYVFATDYPHYDADSADAILPKTIPDELRNRVRFKNAIETYPRLRNLEPAA